MTTDNKPDITKARAEVERMFENYCRAVFPFGLKKRQPQQYMSVRATFFAGMVSVVEKLSRETEDENIGIAFLHAIMQIATEEFAKPEENN